MARPCLLVRIPSVGTVLHETVARHAGSRVTAWAVRRHGVGLERRVEFLALVEGIPPLALPPPLLAWVARHGVAPRVIGPPFAMRLPVSIEKVDSPLAWAVLRLTERMPMLGTVLHDGVLEFWGLGLPAQEMAALSRRLQAVVGHVPGVQIRTGEPRRPDVECWETLASAAEATMA